jgi:predicted lipoprotein with Yx(FWY)xxD motif
VLPSTIQASDVTAFTSGGKQQFVFKGWPLYFYGADDAPGKVSGAGVVNWRAVSGSWNGAF